MSTRIETDPHGPNPVVAAAEQVELAAEWSES